MTDELLVSDVDHLLSNCKKKIKNELESMGVIKRQATKGDNKKKWCYCGMILKIE
jgi:hypothetical protein